MLRRGRAPEPPASADAAEADAEAAPAQRQRSRVLIEHEDIIGDAYWAAHPELLAD